MSAISLQKNIRTCKADTAWANRFQSDRVLNPNNMICPPWTGKDSLGRSSVEDSYYTKSAGCNSALDRVAVENNQRPKYFDQVTLGTYGLSGDQHCYSKNFDNIETRYYIQEPYLQESCQSCIMVPDNRAYYSRQMRDRQWQVINSRVIENKRLSGF